MPPLRRLLFAAVAIVALAAAASWIAQSGPRKFGEPVEVASLERATGTPSQTFQPRRGAGTVGARAGSLGAVAAPGEFRSRASQNGDTDVPSFGRAPRPSPVPQGGSISTDAQPEGDDAPSELAWAGSGVEGIPPPTPGRDPRDSESTAENDAPPVPPTIGGFPPDLPTPRAEPPAPRNDTPAPRTESPSHETPSDSGESVTADSPLTPEQIDDIVGDQLAGLPPEQAEPLEPIVKQDVTDKANQAFGWTNSAP